MDLITDKKKYLLLKCGKLCPKKNYKWSRFWKAAKNVHKLKKILMKKEIRMSCFYL